MRELKFRVWVEAPDGEKAMHYPKLISFGGGDLSWATLQDDSVVKDNGWYTKREAMQYTGLKDKNGKEIYEGDIVKGSQRVGLDDYGIEYELVEGKPFAVTFVISEGQSTAGFDFHTYNLDTLEIIGNIYENPDLLAEGSSKEVEK